MIPMFATTLALLIPPPGHPNGPDPDKVIEITARAGTPQLFENGATKPAPVVAVVGQTVRWVNRDDRAWHFTSTTEADGKPVIDTGVIEPGKHYDLPLDNATYRQLGGRVAGVVTVTFRSGGGGPDPKGELQILSPAKR